MSLKKESKSGADVVRFVWMTDAHNGHNKISNRELATQIIDLLLSRPNKHEIDYLVDTGDFFDQNLIMDSERGKVVTMLITFILTYCAKYKIKLLVLKGTDTHDGRQQEHWGSIRDGLVDKPEFIYMDKIGIHYEEKFNFLCVPDNATSSFTKTEAVVKSILKENNLKQVDIGFTHGMYSHHVKQLGVKLESHCSEYYNSIVRIMIMNGHIHTRSYVDKINTGGSVTRNRQGEEEAKGIHDVTINFKTGESKINFIENKAAFKFYKLKLETLSLEDAIEQANEFINSRFDGSGFLNVTYPEGFPIQALMGYLKEMHPLLTYDTDRISSKDKKSVEEELEAVRMTTVPLTEETLPGLAMAHMAENDITYTDRHDRIFKQILKEVS